MNDNNSQQLNMDIKNSSKPEDATNTLINERFTQSQAAEKPIDIPLNKVSKPTNESFLDNDSQETGNFLKDF